MTQLVKRKGKRTHGGGTLFTERWCRCASPHTAQCHSTPPLEEGPFLQRIPPYNKSGSGIVEKSSCPGKENWEEIEYN
jgi:hypothetical protein